MDILYLPSKTAQFGTACQLMAGAPRYRDNSIGELHRVLMPPIELGQVMFAANHLGKPIGFCTWAFFDEERERIFTNRERKLQAADWKTGDRLWGIDLLCTQDAGSFTRLLRTVICTKYPWVTHANFFRRSQDPATRRKGRISSVAV